MGGSNPDHDSAAQRMVPERTAHERAKVREGDAVPIAFGACILLPEGQAFQHEGLGFLHVPSLSHRNTE